MRRRGWGMIGGLACLLAAASTNARAQEIPVLGPDSFLVVVPIRDTSEIQRELGSAIQAKTVADQDRARAETLRNSARARIDRKAGEIKAIKDRENVAKKEKRSAEAVALEAERKAAEREKKLIDRRESLRGAEAELAKRQAELAEARRQGLELELQLAVRRLDFERAGSPTGPAGARARQVLDDLEKRTLEVQQQEVEKSKNVADRRKDIIKRRLEILEAQRRIVSGG